MEEVQESMIKKVVRFPEIVSDALKRYSEEMNRTTSSSIRHIVVSELRRRGYLEKDWNGGRENND
jgi:hypothetical protein